MPLVRLTSNNFLDVAITDNDYFADSTRSSESVGSNGRSSAGSNSKHDATAWRKKGGNTKKQVKNKKNNKNAVFDDDQSVVSMANQSAVSMANQSVVSMATNNHSIHSMPHQRKDTISYDDCRSAPHERRTPDLTGSVLDFSPGLNNTTTIQENTNDSDVEDQEEDGDEEEQQHSEQDGGQPVPEEQKDILLQMETLKMSFAESQSQVDWYKLRYRHLHNEFTDLQAFCKQLQAENMELRNENESNKGKVSKKQEPWFKMERFAKLNRPKQLDQPGDDWDDTTIATQRTFTTKSSRDQSLHGASGGTPLFDKPNNIIVTTKNKSNNNNNNQNENSAKGMTAVGSDTDLPLREEEGEDDDSSCEVNSADASLEEEKKQEQSNNDDAGDNEGNFLVPSEVDAADQPRKQESQDSFIKKHRFLPRRGSILANIAENIDRRGSMSSIFGVGHLEGEMKEMNLDDSLNLSNAGSFMNDNDMKQASEFATNNIPAQVEASNSESEKIDIASKDVNKKEKKEEKKKGGWRFPWEKDASAAVEMKVEESDEEEPDYTPLVDREIGSTDSERDIVVDLPKIPKDIGFFDDCSKSASTSSSSIDMPQDLTEAPAMQ
mmetsp:Transcript_3971/g.6081  ORF Transcript_3971/g.6081 Transcript_3971/m.6081 type:complete len:606 (+) Transcript_3971:152-1969(+)|eukprot:CAMPEP_0194212262 /NCGR_PEP_ID=MMETSP0156-20130528/11950_1 /TAXON_ID=33649 /ORGANISM="Thalassionema nitzschioides, Strain L26-B" /LENGTH=605 /DNA_ID=CAMNT_0038940039 /DNA_START=58 /DNA_END=1875 /DNA_ORIENTATION=-